jgi:WD40 repeat protein
LDFSPDGKNFAVAGLDCHVYVYDEHTRTIVTTMRVGGKNLPGHSNRIFCVKYHLQDPNILLSGGWDRTI